MTNSMSRYLLVFLGSMLLVQPLILIRAPVGSPVYVSVMTILLGALFAMAFYSVSSFKKVIGNFEGNVKEITKRLFISTMIVMAYLFVSVVNNLNLNKIITLDPLMGQVLGITGFCLIITYFYVIFDVVVHMRKQPKIYDSQKKRLIFEDELVT